MNIHIDATGGLVSNPREKETRGSRGSIAKPLYLKAATSSLGDRHTAKRDKGQLNNRKLMDPSIGKLTQFTHFIWRFSSLSACMLLQPGGDKFPAIAKLYM